MNEATYIVYCCAPETTARPLKQFSWLRVPGHGIELANPLRAPDLEAQPDNCQNNAQDDRGQQESGPLITGWLRLVSLGVSRFSHFRRFVCGSTILIPVSLLRAIAEYGQPVRATDGDSDLHSPWIGPNRAMVNAFAACGANPGVTCQIRCSRNSLPRRDFEPALRDCHDPHKSAHF